jgi:hypothetical protein
LQGRFDARAGEVIMKIAFAFESVAWSQTRSNGALNAQIAELTVRITVLGDGASRK